MIYPGESISPKYDTLACQSPRGIIPVGQFLRFVLNFPQGIWYPAKSNFAGYHTPEGQFLLFTTLNSNNSAKSDPKSKMFQPIGRWPRQVWMVKKWRLKIYLDCLFKLRQIQRCVHFKGRTAVKSIQLLSCPILYPPPPFGMKGGEEICIKLFANIFPVIAKNCGFLKFF